MTLIGQHARRSDYVSENSAEGVNNGNVDKIRWCQKVQVRNIFFRFLENKKHGALRNLISEGSMFFEKMHFLFFLRRLILSTF